MSASHLTQYLTFLVAGEEYAIGILHVKEIIEYEAPTRVPAMPRAIRGVINLRGAVVPVVDLAVKFGIGESAVNRRSCIVIVEAQLDGEKAVVGVMADSVNQVIDLRAEDLEPPPTFGTKVKVDYLQGMAKIEKRFALILDTDRVLSSDELLAAAQALPDASQGAPAAPAVEAAPAAESTPPPSGAPAEKAAASPGDRAP
jgi:purine-binding chemotaxis protein CheW